MRVGRKKREEDIEVMEGAGMSAMTIRGLPEFHPAADVDPRVDAEEFRRCLGQFSTGVTVIAVADEDGPVGITVNSFSLLSLDPPLVLWSLARTSSRYEIFNRAPAFVVNVLARDQMAISRRFAARGDFDDTVWIRGRNDTPMISDAAAAFECRRSGEHDRGDHRIIIGEVTRAIRSDCVPLLFSQGSYRVPADHAER